MGERYLTEQQFQSQNILDRYQDAKDRLIDADPDLAEPELLGYMDNAARDIASREMKQHGKVVSSPREIARQAAKATRTFVDQLVAGIGTKSATDGAAKGESPEKDSGEMSNDAYLDMWRRPGM